MKRLSADIVHFLRNQGFVIVTTVDKNGCPHNSCKGIIKINGNGKVYLLDVYKKTTYFNLKHNPHISIAAVDEHKFKGYCLKGKAKIINADKFGPIISKTWENMVTSRVSQRIIKNLQQEKGHLRHPEILLPQPQYMIAMQVKEVVDLTPGHLK